MPRVLRALGASLVCFGVLLLIGCGGPTNPKPDPGVKPVITAEPQNLTLSVGGTGQFRVEASGTDVSYAWIRGASPNVVGREPALTVGPVQGADNGATYRVTVTNRFGTATSRVATLTVSATPLRIDTPPTSTFATVGGTASFSVVASGGTGPLHYQWRRGTTNLRSDSAVLNLTNVQSSDAGTYTVVVTDRGTPVQSVTSIGAVLTVNAIALRIDTPPASTSAPVGGTASFSVVASGGTGPLYYQWRRGTTNLGSDSAVLNLTNVQNSDAGTYTVVVTDRGTPVQSVTSIGAVLTVNATSLRIDTPPASTSATVGGTASFSVVASGGTGPLHYQWRRGTTNVGSDSAVLNLANVQSSDAGTYTVVVTDRGTPAQSVTSSEAVLTVNPRALVISVQPIPVSVTVGGNASFSVTASGGTGTLHYQWHHGTAQVGGDSAALNLTNVQTTDAGSYSIIVRDSGATPQSVTSDVAVLSVLTSATDSIIIDHTCTDITRIPAQYIRAAKSTLRIAYQHTSHGSQLRTGLEAVREALGAPFDYQDDLDATYSGYHAGAFLNDYFNDLADGSGNNFGASDLGNPWSDDATGETGWSKATRAFLERAGGCDRNVVMWAWCDIPRDRDHMQQYLDNMAALERRYPNVKFVYMTGCLDNGGNNDVADGVNACNRMVREWCRQAGSHRILFDFGDIESFDPDGARDYSLLRGTDGCYYTVSGTRHNWAQEWMTTHASTALAGIARGCPSCRHSGDEYGESVREARLNCVQKGMAFWWLMARLAGWDGTPSPSPAP